MIKSLDCHREFNLEAQHSGLTKADPELRHWVARKQSQQFYHRAAVIVAPTKKAWNNTNADTLLQAAFRRKPIRVIY